MQRNSTKLSAVGFYIYTYELGCDKKSPTINTRKFTEYGILKESEFNSLYNNYDDKTLNINFADAQVNPSLIIEGFYKPSKAPFGIVECHFLTDIIKYVHLNIKDVSEIRVSVINTNLHAYLTNKCSDQLKEKIELALGESFNKDKITSYLSTPYILMDLAQWAHDIPYDKKNNISATQHTKLPNYKSDDPNPYFLNSSLCYFYNKDEIDEDLGYTEYVMSKFDDSEKYVEDGKQMSGYGLSIIRLEKPEPCIEKIKEIHRNSYIERRLGMNSVINLNALLNKRFLDIFMSHENPPLYSHRVTDMNPVTTMKSNDEVLCQDTYRIIRKLDGEEKIVELRKLLNDVLINNPDIKTIDITDLIFSKNVAKNKCEINKSLNGKKDIVLPKEITKEFTRRKLRLKIGYDIPIYRSMNKMTDINTQVLLVLYDKTPSHDNSKFERYSVFIRHGAEVSIWSSVYSNNLFSFLT